jgi:hypothetical protein
LCHGVSPGSNGWRADASVFGVAAPKAGIVPGGLRMADGGSCSTVAA